MREAEPEAVILFGSHARHEARADSDVDLLIIERQPFGPQHSRRKESARLYHALRAMADDSTLDRKHTLEEVSALFAAIPRDSD